MSTLTGKQNLHRIHSEEALYEYFASFAKPRDKRRLGLEAEFLGVDRDTGKALPYAGEQGIEAVLKKLSELFGYERLYEGDHVIALKRGETVISLEPGGQVELSAAPVDDVCEVENQVQVFAGELKAVSKEFPKTFWLSYGIQPFSSLDEVSWVPKHRYEIMAAHLGARGELSHHMMKLTATNQISYDYLSEEDAMSSLRTVLSITSIASALFANSSFSEGKPNGFLTRRVEIWNHTDPERSGLILEFTRPDQTFRDFLNYILQLPVLFVVRKGKWIPLGEINFRQFIQKGYQGIEPVMSDFELHLSTAFPEARLKQYLEVRGMDAQPLPLIPAVAAFWKGILYDRKVRDLALEQVHFAQEEERLKLHQSVAREGLKANLAGRPILPIARELVRLAAEGLHHQRNPGGCGESRFIARIQEKILAPAKASAEQVLEKWESSDHDRGQLFEYLSI